MTTSTRVPARRAVSTSSLFASAGWPLNPNAPEPSWLSSMQGLQSDLRPSTFTSTVTTRSGGKQTTYTTHGVHQPSLAGSVITAPNGATYSIPRGPMATLPNNANGNDNGNENGNGNAQSSSGSGQSSSSSVTKSSGGLSTGAKAGIGVGVALGVILIAALLASFLIRRRRTRKNALRNSPDGIDPAAPGSAAVDPKSGVSPPAYPENEKPVDATGPSEIDGAAKPLPRSELANEQSPITAPGVPRGVHEVESNTPVPVELPTSPQSKVAASPAP